MNPPGLPWRLRAGSSDQSLTLALRNARDPLGAAGLRSRYAGAAGRRAPARAPPLTRCDAGAQSPPPNAARRAGPSGAHRRTRGPYMTRKWFAGSRPDSPPLPRRPPRRPSPRRRLRVLLRVRAEFRRPDHPTGGCARLLPRARPARDGPLPLRSPPATACDKTAAPGGRRGGPDQAPTGRGAAAADASSRLYIGRSPAGRGGRSPLSHPPAGVPAPDA